MESSSILLTFAHQINQTHMSYPICFVSLGPGDPELITLKGLKKLRQAEIIYCPATMNKNGQLLSRAARIIEELGIGESAIRLFTLPMSKDRTEAWKVYDALYEEAASAWDEGKKVVIVAEGDAGFYSSIQYIYDKFRENRIEVERTAGIPAFIAAGALAGLHIVKQEEQIIVIPGTLTAEELSEKIKAGLEVSELLKKIAGINYPVFIDNGESVPVIDNVRPSGQTFISQVVKNEQLRVEILGAAPAGRSEQAA